MSLIDNKYSWIYPNFDFLSDRAIIIQAWKKSHQYIRNHNWFADNLELDLSCLNLEQYCDDWCNILTKSNYKNYTPDPMRIIPAPKACEWELKKKDLNEDDIWQVINKENNELETRPLAHISIKDQTLGMAFLICLANIVEEEQGPVEHPPGSRNSDDNIKEYKKHLGVSYGNRLLCQWAYENEEDEKPEASFQWANVEVYKRYFVDFQEFLKRPIEIAKSYCKELDSDKKIAIISLDLSKCYDRIKRNVLHQKVEFLINRALEETDADDLEDLKQKIRLDMFLEAFQSFLKLSWHQEDLEIANIYQKKLNNESSDWLNGKDGLPQGMVISGFLANIYLMEFDKKFKNLPAAFSENEDFTIIDYCRYVDDMRFVVEVADNTAEDELKEKFTEYIDPILAKAAEGQKLNNKKTKIYFVSEDIDISLVEEEMQEIKSRSSGPINEMSGLEILNLTKNLWGKSRQFANSLSSDEVIRKGIFATDKIVDVKTETMERFAAYSWRRIYRTLTLLLSPCEKHNNEFIRQFSVPCSRKKLDKMAEDFCKEVILRWLKDPSKVRILRIAFDLYPNKDYLETVLDKLFSLLEDNKKLSEYQTATYILSEIYRAASVETGFVHDNEQLPKKSNLDEYRKLLFSKVNILLSEQEDIPWYLANQLILFCTIMFDYSPGNHVNQQVVEKSQKGKFIKAISKAKNFANKDSKRLYEIVFSKKSYSCYTKKDFDLLLLCYKFTHNEKLLTKHFQALLDCLQNPEKHLDKWFSILPDTLPLLKKYLSKKQRRAYDFSKSKTKLRNKPIKVTQIIKSTNNPFDNEIAITRLALQLCKAISEQKISVDRNTYLSPNNLEISCSSWNNIKNPLKRPTLKFNINGTSSDERYKPEAWETSEKLLLGQIGRILRALLMKDVDFTIMRNDFYKKSNYSSVNVPKYWGIRSSWLKRKYGLLFDRIATSGPHIPCSPWFIELLSTMLSFPGSYIPSRFRPIDSLESLKNVLEERFLLLKDYHGNASQTTILPVEIDLDKLNNFKSRSDITDLSVAVVQTVFPTHAALIKDHTLSDVENQKMNRQHLSDMLQILLQKFQAQRFLGDNLSGINLVIFPELSVHKNSIYELERFADKMNCMIFCGLIFCDHPENNEGIINSGIWLIPQHKDKDDRRTFLKLLQGKYHLTDDESKLNISSFRPAQWIIEGVTQEEDGEKTCHWSLSSSMCYDSTDIKLAADLRDHVDCYIISALNKDISTFDNMAQALRYHMYNHTVIVNSGEFGGSTIQAPYEKSFERILLHVHGNAQANITIKKLKLQDMHNRKISKKPPAGFCRKPV